MNKFARFVLDLFFPNRCPVCHNFISFDKYICDNCNKILERNICYDFIEEKQNCGKLYYDKALAVYFYEDIVKDGIYSLKDGNTNFGYFLGQQLADIIKNDFDLIKADMIMPVPMELKRKKQRGYNQAEIISKEISDITKIKHINDILYKKDAQVQHSLNSSERKQNAMAYEIRNINLNGMNIIICDDVITTGSTINRCAELLKKMGAAKVFVAIGTTTKLKKE